MKDNPNKTAAGEAPVTGDIIDELEMLSKLRNFTYTITVQRNKSYGKKLPSGKWSGMMGALLDDVSTRNTAELFLQTDAYLFSWLKTPL